MKPSRIQAITHVNLEATLGLEDELRWFYGELAELAEVSVDHQAGPQLCFRSLHLELRVWPVDQPRVDPVAIRLTLAVRSLVDTAERLKERSVPYKRMSGLLFTDRRLQVRDPAGHLVAFKQEWLEQTW